MTRRLTSVLGKFRNEISAISLVKNSNKIPGGKKKKNRK